jgi:site-specific DNA recombinase
MESKEKKTIRCAIYTRKSTNEGLDQEFTTLDNQREAALNYIASQKGEGWVAVSKEYNDGGFTGANMERPALRKLLEDIHKKEIDCVMVYKVDRLSRSLIDFSKMLELFEQNNVTFVSVTQHFNTNNSMGRLTLNILLSFAQFEREIISERTKDKMAAARKKGRYVGGCPIVGYDVDKENRRLVINPEEAKFVREVFDLFIRERSPLAVANIINEQGHFTKKHKKKSGDYMGGKSFQRTDVAFLVKNIIYSGRVRYMGQIYQGQHEAIISEDTFDKAQEIIASNTNVRYGKPDAQLVALLRHLLRCKHCNKSMTPSFTNKSAKKRYRYYVCLAAQKRGFKTCPTRSVNAESIETAVVDCLKKIATNSDEQSDRVEKINNRIQAELKQLAAEQQDLDKGIEALTAKIKALKDQPTKKSEKEIYELAEALKDKEQQLSQAHIKSMELNEHMISKEEFQKAMVFTSPTWETLYPQEKKRILDFLIKEIDYDGSTETLGITLNENGIKLLSAELSHADEASNG